MIPITQISILHHVTGFLRSHHKLSGKMLSGSVVLDGHIIWINQKITLDVMQILSDLSFIFSPFNVQKKSEKKKGRKEATLEFIHDHFVLAFVAGEGFIYLPGRRVSCSNILPRVRRKPLKVMEFDRSISRHGEAMEKQKNIQSHGK